MVLYIIFILFLVCFLIKNLFTFRQSTLIDEAIFLYHMEQINNGNYGPFEVTWSDEESYDKTLWRLWDWGYTRILPREKYDFLKPYIERAIINRKTGKKHR